MKGSQNRNKKTMQKETKEDWSQNNQMMKAATKRRDRTQEGERQGSRAWRNWIGTQKRLHATGPNLWNCKNHSIRNRNTKTKSPRQTKPKSRNQATTERGRIKEQGSSPRTGQPQGRPRKPPTAAITRQPEQVHHPDRRTVRQGVPNPYRDKGKAKVQDKPKVNRQSGRKNQSTQHGRRTQEVNRTKSHQSIKPEATRAPSPESKLNA